MHQQDPTLSQLSLFAAPEGMDASVVKVAELSRHEDAERLQLLFERLSHSAFRSRFHLNGKDKLYIQNKGWETVRIHAAEFVARRLAPAIIPNDGKQTPMRHVHPVFIAQHATGCCCRGCFEKWHHLPKGRALSVEEQAYAVSVLMAWLHKEMDG